MSELRSSACKWETIGHFSVTWSIVLPSYRRPGAPREINLPAEERDDIYELLMVLFEKRYELLKSVQEVVGWEYPRITADVAQVPARLLRFGVVVGVPWIVTRVIRHSPDLIDSNIGTSRK